ncbi:hypothetical protein SDC9_161840 [bioreactor metagenome]|uniref:Uncharacterized protein n=1 Tax=bioreactor metagenome TaxID=1076179 RepID=A0A645FQQ0_9ZZZZ
MLVVGAEHAALGIFVAQEGDKRFQVPGGSTLPNHDKLAPLKLGDGVAQIMALVVGIDPGGDIGVQIVALKVRRVAVDFFMMGLCRHNFFNGLLVAVDNAHKVHHLRKALHSGMIIKGVDSPIVQNRPGLVQGRGGDAGGQHEPHVHRQALCGLKHILDAVGPHDVGNLVGIGNDGGGAVGQHRFYKFPGTDQRAFQMNMSVQKAGQDDFAGHVRLDFALVAAHAHNQPFGHGDVRLTQLVGKHVDVGCVFQHQVRLFAARRGLNDAPFLQQLSVDFARIAL